MDRVYIFDTTLRDGEQSPGVALTAEQKMQIALQLEKLGVDCIEAGFPKTSPGDFAAVEAIAKAVKNSQVAGLAHADPDAVDSCWNSVKVGVNPRIHVFLSSSDIHIMHQLAKDKETVLEMARSMVARAAGYCSDVEFSPMDATRSDREFVYWMLEQCIAAGATVINIPDTVGYTVPEEFAQFIQDIKNNVSNIDKVRISVHCHNDLGLAVSNSLAAVKAGARQVETCINGIGERAGNAALEEVVMAIRTRSDFFNVSTNINTQELFRTSRMVEAMSGMVVQPNKAIVGANAFRHQSGIHQDGVLKLRETYEIINAEDVGVARGGVVVLGKNSGRHGFRSEIERMGYILNDDEFERAFKAFKDLVDKKGSSVDERDIEAILSENIGAAEQTYKLEFVQVTCGDNIAPTATVCLKGPEETVLQDAAIGTGPVDAVYKAINRIVNVANELTEFTVKSVTEGIDAQGEVMIRVEGENKKSYFGHGADTDIIVASTKAYLAALNKLLRDSKN